MSRTKRTTNKNNIVILCEGTETEIYYFKELRDYVKANSPDRFSDIKIIPIPLDDTPISPRNSQRKSRQLQPSSAAMRYYIKEELDSATYKQYKAQPTRYVREVQLFMEEDGYVEGWAVFDKDTFTHHAEAFALATSITGLHIAFSSYCFEEWFLTHFERNPYPFMTSVCKDGSGKDKGCGTEVVDDCHGHICIGGRLREYKYIPDYAKNKSSIFTKYTLPRLEQCYVNAAWMRTLLSSSAIYERNPYTDVDILVKRLLGDDRIHHWHELDESFPFCGTEVCIHRMDKHIVVRNKGCLSVILNNYNCFLCDFELQNQRRLGFGMIKAGESIKTESRFENENLLCLEDGYNIHYISLN